MRNRAIDHIDMVVIFHVLASGRDQDTGAMRPNDDCLVFTASVGRTAALLEGDAEPVVDRRFVREHPGAMLLKGGASRKRKSHTRPIAWLPVARVMW